MDRESRENSHSREKRIKYKKIDKFEKLIFVSFFCLGGAVPFVPTFENDNLSRVYTATVVQKMMNNELTLFGKNVLRGSWKYRLLDFLPVDASGGHVKVIIEGMPKEGGFPVQANRVRRLAIPTDHDVSRAVESDPEC